MSKAPTRLRLCIQFNNVALSDSEKEELDVMLDRNPVFEAAENKGSEILLTSKELGSDATNLFATIMKDIFKIITLKDGTRLAVIKDEVEQDENIRILTIEPTLELLN